MRLNSDRGKNIMRPLSAIVTAMLLLAPGLQSEAAEPVPNLGDPTRVIEGYVRAIYARDYIAGQLH
jgi:hypothetical protein